MLERVLPLIGDDGIKRLKEASVLLFGCGGVGCAVAESLARAGVGKILLCDGDVYAESNLNRQLYALRDTIGKNKAAVAAERIKSINPDCAVTVYDFFCDENSINNIDFAVSYVADCIDSVREKVRIIEKAKVLSVPVISCMGAGNRLNPMAFGIVDINQTSLCPLARVMRHELKARGISKVKTVCSTEPPVVAGLTTPSSISFVPPAAGLCLAGEIVRDITGCPARDERKKTNVQD